MAAVMVAASAAAGGITSSSSGGRTTQPRQQSAATSSLQHHHDSSACLVSTIDGHVQLGLLVQGGKGDAQACKSLAQGVQGWLLVGSCTPVGWATNRLSCGRSGCVQPCV